VAFRWLLNAEEYVPHAELALVRQHVVLASSRVIGVMSAIRLSDIASVFVSKLEERVVISSGRSKDAAAPRADFNVLRAQALKLCAGVSLCMGLGGGQLGGVAAAAAGTAPAQCPRVPLMFRRSPAGMRSVVLSFGDDRQLEQSTAFLLQAHPLNYTAAVKKSQVHVCVFRVRAGVPAHAWQPRLAGDLQAAKNAAATAAAYVHSSRRCTTRCVRC
jgi:hypothetical protein